MEEEKIKKYVEEISFRLLATKKHADYEWLKELLTDMIKESCK
jgi:hypothetical protein